MANSLTMEVKFENYDVNKIIDNFNMKENGKVDLFIANNAFRRMHEYVPYDTGALSETVTIAPGSVTYNVPYAHKQYTSNKGNGKRGKYWDKLMWSAEKEVFAQEVEDFIKRNKK